MSIQDIVKRAVLALGFEERAGTIAYDSSLQANNCTLSKDNGVLPQWVAGKDGFGGALEFDGAGSYLPSPIAPNSLTDFTISIWVYIGAHVADARIYESVSGGANRFYFRYSGVSGQIVLGLSDWNPIISDGYTLGEWEHYIIVLSGTDGFIYRRGRLISSTTSITIDLPAATITFGSTQTGSDAWLDGKLGEILILPYALTAAEVRALYESRSPFTATPNLRRGLVLDLDLQEGAGLTAFDRSIYANNGALGPGAGAIVDEAFTSVFDTPVQLDHTNITPASTVVTDNGVTFTEGVDYTMDNANGTITVLSGAGMANDTSYNIDYDYADSYPAWVEGGGLDFDGVDDYVEVAHDAGLAVTKITVVCWIYPHDTFPSDTEGIVCRHAEGVGHTWYIYRLANGTIFFYCYGPDDSVTSSAIAANAWIHVVATYDGVALRIYLNGVLNNSNPATGDITIINVPPVWIGKDWFAVPSRIFDGIIDEVHIYNRALTPAEIRALYEEGR